MVDRAVTTVCYPSGIRERHDESEEANKAPLGESSHSKGYIGAYSSVIARGAGEMARAASFESTQGTGVPN